MVEIGVWGKTSGQEEEKTERWLVGRGVSPNVTLILGNTNAKTSPVQN